jgi:5-formyltetrahydrofolate cyclo-ligase
LTQADCFAWSQSIQHRAIALSCYRDARSVVLYSPVQNEVDSRAILDDALASGKKVFYPKLVKNGVPGFARVFSAANLVSGRFGILEPVGSDALTPSDRDGLIVFVPGVLFDRCGNRLGRGGGWYDRALDELGSQGVFVGLAYEAQIVDRLAAESWDRKVHFIVTENELIDCGMAPHSSSRTNRRI